MLSLSWFVLRPLGLPSPLQEEVREGTMEVSVLRDADVEADMTEAEHSSEDERGKPFFAAPTEDVEQTDEGKAPEKRERVDAEEKVTVASESEEANVRTPSEEAPRHPLWKTSLCSYFQRSADACVHGAACRFAHGDEELRPRPDNSWDPNSQIAKKLKTDHKLNGAPANGEHQEIEQVDVVLAFSEQGKTALDKCLIGLPMKWTTENLENFLHDEGISYKTVKKKKGMTAGFLSFDDVEQVKSAIEALGGKSVGRRLIKVTEVNCKTYDKKPLAISDDQSSQGASVPDDDRRNGAGYDGDLGRPVNSIIKSRSVCDVVTPLAKMPYADQLEHKKNSLAQTLKRLTRNARKACPSGISLPDWILKAKEIGGLPCRLEGIISSPVTEGYRNKCEFSVGYSPQGKKTVGFMLGNFREGITAVMKPIDCPNVSFISCKYASMFQEFLLSSNLPVWNRIENTGFWRQLTVREGRSPQLADADENGKPNIAEVMLVVQVCTSDVDEHVINDEFDRMIKTLTQGASECSPPLPLTSLVVQDHKGISNAAPTDCPLRPLPILDVEGAFRSEDSGKPKERIHDYINNLQFSISPTAFFQVNTLAAEKLYSLAGEWANLCSDTLLFDVCCGTGTIGLTLAHHVGMVVGIEMNASAVLDAQRNAEINGIKNCNFVCGKAEDVMGDLLKKYLGQPEYPRSVQTKYGDDVLYEPRKEDSLVNDNPMEKDDCYSVPLQFQNVVAIVDPPRVGLHHNVIKTLRTHPRLRRLVYISCNPESMVANAIELCTPATEQPQSGGRFNGRAWRNMSSAGLARHRAKSMPFSEPFHPVKAMAVDLFPHTPHCEIVMLLER